MLQEAIIRVAQPMDIDDLIDVNIRTWATTYRDIVHDDTLNSMTPESLRPKWERILSGPDDAERFCYVAAIADRVIGYVICGKNRDAKYVVEWELYAIYLLKDHHGQGIGAKLFLKAVEEMKKRKIRSFILFVLTENHNTRKFYESFQPDYRVERPIEIDGRIYSETGYGWSDLTSIQDIFFRYLGSN